MTQPEDPAEEYFRRLEQTRAFEDTDGQRMLGEAREEYRRDSRYTDTYWNRREDHIMRRGTYRPPGRDEEENAETIAARLVNLQDDRRRSSTQRYLKDGTVALILSWIRSFITKGP